jgi:6-phosphofructokinase 2
VAEPHDWTEILALLERVSCGWIVASGSLEPGMPPDLYATIARLARRRGIQIGLDTSGAPLRSALEAGVDFVKPSLSELESFARRALPLAADQEAEAMALVRAGRARMVAVTLGDQGAFLATADGVIRMPAIPVPFQGAVGAGDSFVAAMIWALTRDLGPAEALRWAVAAGSATCSRVGTARVRLADVEEWHGKLGASEAAELAASG